MENEKVVLIKIALKYNEHIDIIVREMFHKEYAVSKDNPFKYVTIDEILDILENGSGIILFGTSDSEVSAKTVKIFFEAMKETGHEKERIYY